MTHHLDMNREDFVIGEEFYTATGKWRCTDIGTRVIVAVRVDMPDLEEVFNEFDIGGCSKEPFRNKAKQLDDL